jgi:hypothetical protein
MHMVVKTLSTHVSIILTQVSVPAEDGSQQSATFTHALKIQQEQILSDYAQQDLSIVARRP